MFEGIIAGSWLVELMDNADKIIQNYYKIYEPVYTYIMRDLLKKLGNKCLVSSPSLLLENKILLNEPLQIFVIEPSTTASFLFNALCKKFGKGFVFRTEIKDIHYSIDFKTKHYIRISKIKQYKSMTLLDFISPLKINGSHNDTYTSIYVLPPLLELIDLYKNLYNPENFGDWCTIMDKINKIKEVADKKLLEYIDAESLLHKQNIKPASEDIRGGKKRSNKSDTPDTTDTCVGMTCKAKKKMQIDELKALLLDFLKSYGDYVVIEQEKESVFNNMGIISKNTIQTDFERLHEFFANYTDYSIIYKKKNLFIGKDNRINKHTIYINMSKYDNIWSIINKPILDIYNNSSYELIPYVNQENLKILHPWAQSRFIYIEIWNILAAYKLNMISLEKFIQLVSVDMKKIKKININMDDVPINYIGFYINEYQAYKQEMINMRQIARNYC